MPNELEGQPGAPVEPVSPIQEPVTPNPEAAPAPAPDQNEPEYATWDQIKAYVESQGFQLVEGQAQPPAAPAAEPPPAQAPAQAPARPSAPAPPQNPPAPQPSAIEAMRSRANDQYRQDMRNAIDDEERAEALIKYQSSIDEINGRVMAQQQAAAQMPIVEQQFKDANLPPEAAQHYVRFLLESENPYDEATRIVCMQRAVGMVAIDARTAPAPGPTPSNVRLPGGDAPSGPAGALPDTDPVVEASLRQTFPGLVLTPEVRRDFRARGIL